MDPKDNISFNNNDSNYDRVGMPVLTIISSHSRGEQRNDQDEIELE
jgi:hypothetical protein